MKRDVTRLLDQFNPENYKLTLDIDDVGLKFSGTVIIDGKKVGKPSKRLTFHQKDLKITNAKIVKLQKDKSFIDVPVKRTNIQKKLDEVRLHSDQIIYPGKYTITIDFTGSITKPMDGIYPCFFKHNGQDKRLIATQFESHHARQAFPCIDEPSAKATFNLTLKTREQLVTVSNTPITKQTSNNNGQVTVFDTTPVMSTYLLAFVIGDMGYKEAKTKRGVTVRTYATPDNVNHTKFALDTAVKVLDYYEEYFGIEYPLAKCDMIALPDFASGAMENWGCITYREVCMLDDPKNTSLSNRQLVALVVAHELAHQWFGNLVTMRWWTDLWLNEGFASWIEYLAVDHLFPEWNLWEQFLVSERERGLKLDALESTHPIEVPVHHPDEIRTIFDSISYSKGASIINMLHDYLGKDLFRSGLHAYLAKHKYANTDTVDLWTSLEIVSKKPVKEFMHTWTSKPGFPVLKVTKNDNSYNLEQSRFFLKNDKNDDGLWPLPLLSKETSIDILSNKHAVLDMKTNKPAIFNHGQSGFYRVGYSSDLVDNIIESLDSIQMVDKIGLLCDLTENTKNGISTSQSVLKILPKFKQVNHSSVWDVISGWIGITKMVMDDERLREDIKKYVCDLIDPQYKRLGWEKKSSDTIDDQLLRPTILGMGISADHPEITKKALEIFKSVKQASDVDPSLIESIDDVDIRRSIEVDPDLRGVVFGAASKHGDESDFNKLLDLHNKTSNSEERDALCAAITGFRQPDLIVRSLELIKSDHVRLQDVTYWIVYSFMNRHAKNMTWSWLKVNWQWLRKNFEGDLGFYRIPIFAARCFSSEEFKKDYTNFFDPLRDPAFNRSIDQGLETLSWHIDWRNRDLKNIQNFLANY